MKQRIHFTKFIQSWGVVLIVGLVVIITALDIIDNYHDFRLNSDQMRTEHIGRQKQIIRQEVKRVVDLISYEKEQSEKIVRDKIKSRIYEAHAIAQYIYQQNNSVKSPEEIQKMIKDALRPIRFEHGVGYYFISRLDGVAVVFPSKPGLEGVDLQDVQDSHGQYLTRDIIKIVEQSDEGFYEYHWTKPNAEGNDFKKISFVKGLGVFDWFIGTGLYVDDVEEQIKGALLATIIRIRFGKEGYVFVNRLNGDALVSNGKHFSGNQKLWEVFNKNPEAMKTIFAKEYNAAVKPEGDYIYYSHIKLTTPDVKSPKTSFIYGIPEWQWLVGAGVYLDDIEEDIALMQAELNKEIKGKIVSALLIALGIVSLFLLLFRKLNRRLEQDIKLFTSFFNRAAISDELIDRDLVYYDELDRMAKSANTMVQDKIEAEKQLTMFKTFADSSTQGMGWAAADGSIKYVNSALATLLGEKDQSAPVGKNVVLTYYPEDVQQRLTNEIFPSVVEAGEWSGELMLRTIHGELIPTHNSLFFIANEAGKPLFYANIVTDITQWKQAEREKEKLTEKLHTAQKMESIGLMAGGVAHDLNNILSGIIGYPELILQNLPRDSKLKRPLEAIQQSGQRAATVVADLLTVARGAATLRERHDLNTLIETYMSSPECEQLMALHPDVTLQHGFESDNSVIFCSPVHIQKCLMNLVINACEAIEDTGTVTVSTCNQHIDEELHPAQVLAAGEYVILSVEDTGPGISRNDLDHIFEPFYTKKVLGKSGSGLGLTVVWNTMEDHGGKVLVESSTNGTCFQLFFPVSKGEIPGQSDCGDVEKIRGRGERVLVVDDELQLRDIACQMLTSLGYSVDVVESGESAVEFVKKTPVDLLVIDMLMEPGINGRQTYEKITKIYPDQKAVVASGFSESEDVKATLQLGAGGFIKKPYSREQLGRAVTEVLNG